MASDRWGFEDTEDWEYEALADRSEPTAEQLGIGVSEYVVGEDADAVVTVTMSPTADVETVRLASNWHEVVDPRALHTSVVAASNAAMMQALAHRMAEGTGILKRRVPPAGGLVRTSLP